MPRQSIAVVVISHNGAKHLDECLRSVKAQSMVPDELVYVDDASTDDSVRIAESLGFKVFSSGAQTPVGMCKTRMVGVRNTTSALILFVDGDDVLPGSYLAELYIALGDCDLSYPGAFRFFGDDAGRIRQRAGREDGKRELAAPSRARLWQANHVSTCSLWRRSALIAAGGWQDTTPGTMADWSLALRVTALGGGYARSKAVLDYRLHPENWTAQERPGTPAERCGQVRRDAASITIGCVYSGRLPDLWPDWLEAVARSLHAAGKSAELIVLDDSAEGDIGSLAPDEYFSSITVRRLNSGSTTETRRSNSVDTCTFLAGQCNDLLRSARGDVLWIVEDDIIVPANACVDLLHELLQSDGAPRPAVCGAYRNRHREGNFVAAEQRGGRAERWTSLPKKPTPVQLTGTGCLMMLRELLPAGLRFQAELALKHRRTHSHDWTLTYRLHALKQPVMLVPSVLCRHHTTVEEWV